MKCVSLNPLTKFKPKSPYLPTHLIDRVQYQRMQVSTKMPDCE